VDGRRESLAHNFRDRGDGDLNLLENQIADRIAVEDESGHPALPVPLKNHYRDST
jgi:hypothetical protein